MAYKIEKSKKFEKQIRVLNLSEKDKRALNKKIKEIAKDPYNVKGSMSVSGKESPEELLNWVESKPEIIDLVLEYLYDKNCLNKKGRDLARAFFNKYMKLCS